MNTKIKVLIVEHDPVDIELLHHELKTGGIDFVSKVVQNEAEYCIKSRADLYNGTVTIVSYLGRGYELKVALSLNSYVRKPALLEIMSSL